MLGIRKYFSKTKGPFYKKVLFFLASIVGIIDNLVTIVTLGFVDSSMRYQVIAYSIRLTQDREKKKYWSEKMKDR